MIGFVIFTIALIAIAVGAATLLLRLGLTLIEDNVPHWLEGALSIAWITFVVLLSMASPFMILWKLSGHPG